MPSLPETTNSSLDLLVHDRISIVGAGPAGFALAVDLGHHGIDVLLYAHPDHQGHADGVKSKGSLWTRGIINSSMLPRMTSDTSEMLAFSTTIILTVPSTGQKTIWLELSRYDLQHHTLIAVPGNLFSLVVDFPLNARHILETNLSPYSCRMAEGELAVMGKKSLFFIALSNTEQDPGLMRKIQDIFPMQLRWCHDVIEVCLSNINGVFHPLMVLMNAGRIESTGGDFYFYANGLTRSVANAILAVDRVRVEIGQVFGFSMKTVIETSNECYGHDFTDLVDLAQNSKPHRQLKAPGVVETRNISEDVADLLVCWHGLAEKLEIDAAPLAAVISLAGMAAGKDYWTIGRNLVKLGLGDLSRSELIERFGVAQDARKEIRK